MLFCCLQTFFYVIQFNHQGGVNVELFERLKFFRKSIMKLTQDDFAKQINLSRSNLASIETGKVSLTDRNIILICETFNVNEHWLRTGEGEMFRKQSEEEEIAAYMGKLLNGSNVDTNFQKRFVKALSKLSIEDWKVIEKFCDQLMLENEKEKGE